MTTPMCRAVRLLQRRRAVARAAASGSRGSSSTRSMPSCRRRRWTDPRRRWPSRTPSRCCTISTSGPLRTMRFDLRQDQLDQPRVLGDLGRQRYRHARSARPSGARPSGPRPSTRSSAPRPGRRAPASAGRSAPELRCDQRREVVARAHTTGTARQRNHALRARRRRVASSAAHARTCLRRRGRTCSPYSSRNRSWSGPGAWNTRWLEAELDVAAGSSRHARRDRSRRSSARLGPLDRQRVGQLFHLERILDRHLLLGRQRQRRPVPRVVSCARCRSVSNETFISIMRS